MSSSDDSIKRPLTARLDSFDGLSEGRRNSPSPHSMLASTLQNASANHHYANPEQLKKEVEIELRRLDGRKKNNIIYESTTPLKNDKTNMLNNNNNDIKDKRQKKRTKIYVILASVIAIVLALLAAAIVFFVLSKDKMNNTESPINSEPSSQTFHGGMQDDTLAQQLQHNLTYLMNNVIPSMQKEIERLKEQGQNQPVVGPVGPIGPPGPTGAGDFSKCKFKTYEKRSAMNKINPEKSETTSMYIPTADEQNKFIWGIICSTVGAAQYNLVYGMFDGQRKFACKCAGSSTVPAFKSTDFMKCRIHFWECPMTTA